MNLDEMIIAVYCTVDDAVKQLLPQLPQGRLRQSGPPPLLSESEVLTIEVMGLFLGHAQDSATFHSVRRHHRALFPALAQVHRTTYTRQSANLWRLKHLVNQHLVNQLPYHAHLHFLDSVPLPVCRSAVLPAPRSVAASTAKMPWDFSPAMATIMWLARPSTVSACTCKSPFPAWCGVWCSHPLMWLMSQPRPT